MFILMTLPPSTVLSARMVPTTPVTFRTGAIRTAFGRDVLSRIRICHRLAAVDIVASSFRADISQETASCLDMALLCVKRTAHRNEPLEASIQEGKESRKDTSC